MLRTRVVPLAVVALVACDVPTEVPRWDQTWVVPGEAIEVGVVSDLLPAGVQLNADTTAFLVDAPGTSVQFSLSDLCGGACGTVSGVTIPKPEFGDTLTSTSTLPADLVEATLSGGSLAATMAHDFNFDPLRPTPSDPNAPRGYLVIRVTSNGNVVARDSVHGNDVDFPEGSTLTRQLDVQPVVVSNTLNIEVSLYSPAGDPATIELTDTLGVEVATSTLEIASATVNASAVNVAPVTTDFDFGGVDSTLVERIQSGALDLDISNPFTVTGSLDVTFQGITPTIQRTLNIAQGEYQDRLEFTGAELQAILGADAVDVVASGSVTPEGGTITLTPTQVLVLDNQFELVVLVGSTEDL